jgi:hypothetical protein
MVRIAGALDARAGRQQVGVQAAFLEDGTGSHQDSYSEVGGSHLTSLSG